MKRLKQLMSVALLCVTASLSAQNCCPPQTDCNPCCDWFSDCEFSVFGEYLYWDVCRNSRTIAVQATGGLNTRNFNFASKYESGYRVGGSFSSSCWNLCVRYASLNVTKSTEGLIGTQADIMQLYTDKFDYQSLDIQVGREICFNKGCGTLTPFIGFRAGWIDESLNGYSDGVLRLLAPNSLNAYGVSLGANFDWKIWTTCIPVSFVTRGTIALLKGSNGAGEHLSYDTAGVLTLIDHQMKTCNLMFVPDIYVGFEFDLFCCDCFWANAQIGYEAQLWASYLFAGATPNFTRGLGNLSLNGLVARFQVGF